MLSLEVGWGGRALRRFYFIWWLGVGLDGKNSFILFEIKGLFSNYLILDYYLKLTTKLPIKTNQHSTKTIPINRSLIQTPTNPPPKPAQCSGLRTALVEQADFASGTSSRSTKLLHGGVRYLQKAILGAFYLFLNLIIK